jgi:putative transposase
MLRGYRYRLIPTTRQKHTLRRWIGACRFVYNCGLIHRSTCHQQWRQSISYFDQQNTLPEIKKDPEFAWLKEVPSQSLQMALRHLDSAFKNFFEGRAGYPRSRRKGIHDSITFPQGDSLKIRSMTKKRSRITLPKMGEIEFIQHRKFTGKLKRVTLSYSHGDGWEMSILVEEQEVQITNLAQDAIGIDLGVEKTIATSQDGLNYSLPTEQIKRIEERLAMIQKRKAKHEKQSSRRQYFARIEARLYARIARIRRNFLHQVSFKLSKSHGVIAMEDLRVKNMSKSASGTPQEPGKNVSQKRGLNRAILRQGWGIFRTMMEYKSRWYGSRVIFVNPQNTSRRCSRCGFTHEANRQTQAEFQCLKCGHLDDADRNAAENIKRLGLESLGACALEAPAVA